MINYFRNILDIINSNTIQLHNIFNRYLTMTHKVAVLL